MRTFVEIFDINKPFPKELGNGALNILVQFKNPYTLYLQASLEPEFLLMETEFLARFKKVMFDGRIAPLEELQKQLVPPHIFPCINSKTNKLTLIDFKESVEYKIQGKYLEEFIIKPINLKSWLETSKPYVISDKRFAEELIESYRLENPNVKKNTKPYNVNYFDAFDSNEKESEILENVELEYSE